MHQGTDRRSTRSQPSRRVLAMVALALLPCCTLNAIDYWPPPHVTLPPHWISRVLFACIRRLAGGTEGPGDVTGLALPYRGKPSAGRASDARLASLARV